MQIQPGLSAVGAARSTVAAQGPLGLYKGMLAPLATVAAFNAVLFSSRGLAERVLSPDGAPCAHPLGDAGACCAMPAAAAGLLGCYQRRRVRPTAPASDPTAGSPLTTGQSVVAGAAAGVPVSLLATPTELLKCRLQAQARCRACLPVCLPPACPTPCMPGCGATLPPAWHPAATHGSPPPPPTLPPAPRHVPAGQQAAPWGGVQCGGLPGREGAVPGAGAPAAGHCSVRGPRRRLPRPGAHAAARGARQRRCGEGGRVVRRCMLSPSMPPPARLLPDAACLDPRVCLLQPASTPQPTLARTRPASTRLRRTRACPCRSSAPWP